MRHRIVWLTAVIIGSLGASVVILRPLVEARTNKFLPVLGTGTQGGVSWQLTLPHEVRAGKFSGVGIISVGADPALGYTRHYRLQVIVSDPFTGDVFDSRDHGLLSATHTESHQRTIREIFNFPPGQYSITFHAVLAKEDGEILDPLHYGAMEKRMVTVH